jgi:hypothetical protein
MKKTNTVLLLVGKGIDLSWTAGKNIKLHTIFEKMAVSVKVNHTLTL